MYVCICIHIHVYDTQESSNYNIFGTQQEYIELKMCCYKGEED